MASTFSRGVASFVFCAAFAATGVSAQTTTSFSRGIVSVDLLRHPIDGKVRKLLRSAAAKMQSGDHAAAIEELRQTLAKYPNSAVYVHSLLGVAYVKTDRLQSAVNSFEQAALLLPHDAGAHYNFGLSLVCTGDYERGQAEVRLALELEPKNAKMQEILNALAERKRSKD